MLKNNLLILDLDETLIYATEKPLSHKADHMIDEFHVYRRPYLNEFIVRCFEMYKVAVWSSASDEYVSAVVKTIFPEPGKLEFVWGRSRATLPRSIDPFYGWPLDHRHYVKTLSKVAAKGWPIERVLIVDDTPEKSVRNYGNAIYPSVFEGDQGDEELRLLARYLETLQDCKNVRKIEKRGWRSWAHKNA